MDVLISGGSGDELSVIQIENAGNLQLVRLLLWGEKQE